MDLEDQTDDLMGRLLRLLEKMRDNLLESGYVFDSPQSEQVFEQPLPNVRRKIAEMEAYFGSFPALLKSLARPLGP